MSQHHIGDMPGQVEILPQKAIKMVLVNIDDKGNAELDCDVHITLGRRKENGLR